MRVDPVRIFDDADYGHVRGLCDSTRGWIEARVKIPDVSAATMYDVLHDEEYRRTWDKHMTQSKDIAMLNPNNDVCYYALKGMPPIYPRDFVLHRSWLDTPEEKLICSRSVCHQDFPPQKGHVRGIVLVSGYLVRPLPGGGCEVIYVTHSDPGGKLPTWFVNRASRMVAPKVLDKLHKAALKYGPWKQSHRPHHKPWLFPEQMELPRLDIRKCEPREYDALIVDESGVAEEAAEEDDSD